MQDLGTLGGSFAQAYGINGAGQIVGNSTTVGDAEEHAFVVSVSVSPPAQKTALLAEMRTFRATLTHRKEARELDEAVEEIEESLHPTLWSEDGMHLVTRHGKRVFDEEKDAVGELRELIKKNPALSVTVQLFIDTMVAADRILAQIAISEAAGYDRRRIAEANAEMAKGDADNGRGKFINAIEHYGNAWKKALEARSEHDGHESHDGHEEARRQGRPVQE